MCALGGQGAANQGDTAQYLVRNADKDYNIADDLVNLKEAFNTLPGTHRDDLAKYINEVVLGDNGASRYDRAAKTLYATKGASREEFTHELGHAFETKINLYKNDRFLKILDDNFGDIDILEDVEYNTTLFAQPVYLVLSQDMFVSDYQRQIYQNDMFGNDGIDYKTFKINTKAMQEYFSEGYREYFISPGNLKSKDSGLYEFIKELLGYE